MSNGGLTPAQIKAKKDFDDAMKKKAWLAEQAKQSGAAEKAEWKGEAKRDLYDPEQKAIFEKRKALAEGMGGELQKAGAERGLQAQMAAAGAGRGSAAQRMRGLTRAGEAGVKSAASMGAQAGQTQASMLGQAGAGKFGMQKSDKAGRLGYYQKSRGLDVAEKAAQAQAAATRAANSGGKASGGEIFKSFKKKNGQIKGPGTETSDSVRAKLSDGEFVVNAKTVRGIGESMGAKDKDQSRKVGAGFLYDLQTKYGDKKPVNKAFGGMEIADLAAHAAKSGAFGKKMKVVGEVGSAAIGVKKGLDTKKASDLDAGVKEKEMDELKAFKHKSEKASGLHPSQKAFEQMAKGGDINLGKGVKAKRKFREAIGWEADKIFEKKAEKAYKEGHTGYKNWKGDSVLKLGRGGFLGSLGRVGLGALSGAAMGAIGGPAGMAAGATKGAAMGAAKAGISEKMRAEKEKQQKKSNIAMGEAEAQSKVAQSGKQMASEDIELKKGGSVIDRPKLNVERLLKEPLGKEYRLPEYGDDIDSPSKKKLEPRSTKKPPPWMRKKEEPIKLETGKFIDLSGDKPHKKGMKKGIEIFLKKQEADKKLKKIRDIQKKSGDKFKNIKDLGRSGGRLPVNKYKILKGIEDTAKQERLSNKKIGLKREASRQSKSDDSLAKKLAEKALKTSKLRRGKPLRGFPGLIAQDKTKKIYNQYGPEFAKKIKAHMKDLEPLVRSEKIGAKVYSPEKLKQMEKHYKDRKIAGEAEAGRLGRKKVIEADEEAKRDEKRGEQAAGEHDVRQTDKRDDYKKQQEIKTHAAKVAAEAAAREKKDVLGDARGLEGNKSASKAMKKYWDKKAAAKKAEEDRAALSVEAGRRETKSIMAKPKDKEEPGMSDSDKAQIGLGIGKGLLSARQSHLKEKQRKKEALARGLRISEGTRAASGHALIGAPVSLRKGGKVSLHKGGKVSFKDVLKAKKKMGY